MQLMCGIITINEVTVLKRPGCFFETQRTCCVVNEYCRCRRQTTKMLDSSPLQIALCVLVVLDAAIVLSEILIDLHAMRCQFSVIYTNY